MTTETAPAERTERSEIDMRWEMVMYGRPVRQADDGGISLHPTKVFYRVDRGLEDIAASLCDDGVWDEEMQNIEGDSLSDLTGEAWEVIEKMFKEWAARAPQRRDIIRAGWAAEKAAKAGTAA